MTLENNTIATIQTRKRRRIGNVLALILVAVAAIVDGIQFLIYLIGLIPFFGQVAAIIFPPLVSVMAWIMFFIWYKLLGIDFLEGAMRKGILLFGNALVEMVPLVSALPMWTLGTILMIAITRVEDAFHNMHAPKRREDAMRAVTGEIERQFTKTA